MSGSINLGTLTPVAAISSDEIVAFRTTGSVTAAALVTASSLQGAAGPAGPQGPQGIQGSPGAAGAAGASINSGSVIGTALQLVRSDGTIVNVSGSVVGPAGAAGATGPAGPTGPQGSAGATGPAGPAINSGTVSPAGALSLFRSDGTTIAVAGTIVGATGPIGPQGPQGNAGTGLNNRGAWVSGTTYSPGDYVFAPTTGSSGATSLYVLNHIGTYVSTTEPDADATNWNVLTAPAGATGATGPTGPAGPSINSGTVTTGGALSFVRSDGTTIAVSGTIVGAAGPTGPTGPTGPAGPNLSVSTVTNPGSTDTVLLNVGGAGTLTPEQSTLANFFAKMAVSAPITNTAGTIGATGVELQANKGVASGYAGLDSTGKVPTAQLPASVVGDMDYVGAWNASTNTPTLTSGTGTKGALYKVSVAGTTTLDGNSVWSVGDYAVFDGATWDKFDGAATEVTSVVGQTGVVTAAQIAAALPVAAVGTKGILSVDGTSIAVNGSGVASVVGTAPTAASSAPALSALQLITPTDTYLTGAQLVTSLFPGGASSLVTGTGAALTLGTNLSISGTTLNAAAGSGFTAVPFATGSSPVTSGSTQTLAWSTTSTSAIYEYVLGANTTFSLGTPPTGVDARIELRVKNDAAGTYTATAPTPSGGWAGTTAPAPVTGANAIAVYKFAASSFGVLGSY